MFCEKNADLDWTKYSVIERLDLIYPIFSRLDEPCFYHSSVIAMAELIKHGCTTAFDHQYNYPRHAGYPWSTGLKQQSFWGCGFMRAVAVIRSKSAGSTIPDEMLETTDEFISDCERLIDTYHNAEKYSMRQVVSPHVSPSIPISH